MKCSKVLRIISEIDIDMLPDDVLKHCDGCPDCAHKLSRLKNDLLLFGNISDQKRNFGEFDITDCVMSEISIRGGVKGDVHTVSMKKKIFAAAAVFVIFLMAGLVLFAIKTEKRNNETNRVVADMFYDIYVGDELAYSGLGMDEYYYTEPVE